MNTILKRALNIVLFAGLTTTVLPAFTKDSVQAKQKTEADRRFALFSNKIDDCLFGKTNDSTNKKIAKRSLTGAAAIALGLTLAGASNAAKSHDAFSSTLAQGACDFALVSGIFSGLFGFGTIMAALDALSNKINESLAPNKDYIEEINNTFNNGFNALSQKTQNAIKGITGVAVGSGAALGGLYVMGETAKSNIVDTQAIGGATGFCLAAGGIGLLGYGTKKLYDSLK